MEIMFKMKFDTGTVQFNGLDMYHGTKAISAFSEFLLISTHGLFHNEILVQAPSAKGFRLVLKQSKEGSWEQYIQLIITDPNVIEIMNDMGKNALYDFLKYLLSTLVGIPFILKNRKAKKRIRELEQQNDDLHIRLENALLKMHGPVKSQGYSVAMSLGRNLLVQFNQDTLEYLETEIESEDYEIVQVAVSRFNARTGTGRFITSMDSTSYGFNLEKELSDNDKTIMADNLAQLTRGNFIPIRVMIKKITSKDGSLKRYKLNCIC